MPRVLQDSGVDTILEEIEEELSLEEEAQAASLTNTIGVSDVQDLSDGGRVGGVDIYPTEDGRRMEHGRATVRRAWTVYGAESMLPLAYEPSGKTHDNAMRYLRKRFCLCCRNAGFVGICRQCRKNQCGKCQGGKDRKQHIPAFYLRYDKVPFKQEFYGSIDCFLPSCLRTGKNGFKTQEDMRMHARNRHRQEYQSHLEVMQSDARLGLESEVALLRAEINALKNGNGNQPSSVAVAESAPPTEALEAPLYVSDKPKPAKRGRRKKRV